MPKIISVASTYATDVILDDKQNVLSVQPGGPLYFIERVFKEQKVENRLYHGDEAKVEIKLQNGEELGKISNKLSKKTLSGLGKLDWLLVSSVLDEWIIDKNKINKLFLDIQGFVRVGKTYGKKHIWHLQNNFSENIYCIKGTEEEIKYLEPDFINKQKNKLLIITKGSNGSELFYKGKLYTFRLNKPLTLNNSVGAGDTFFAYFIAHLSKYNKPLLAMEFATENTSNYLSKRTRLS